MTDIQLFDFSNEKSIKDFFTKTTTDIVAGVSALLTTDKNEYILAGGRIIQAALKGKMLNQLGNEIKDMVEKGKIKERWFEVEYTRMSFVELLKFIDSDVPDEERLQAMKSLFYMSASNEAGDEEARLTYELMQICKQLNSGDIQILKSIFNYLNKPEDSKIFIDKSDCVRNSWFTNVAQLVGHGIAPLVEQHEENLFRLKLISKTTHSDSSGFESTPYYRVTELGYQLCRFITAQ